MQHYDNSLVACARGHIQGNETADSLALDYSHTNTIKEFQIPPEDAITICKNIIQNKWTQDYILDKHKNRENVMLKLNKKHQPTRKQFSH